MLIRETEYTIDVIACRGDDSEAAEGFVSFEEVNAYIEGISTESEVFKLATSEGAEVLIAMTPRNGGAGHVCNCYAGNWSALEDDAVDAIIAEMEDFADLEGMVIDGQTCILRLYVENSASKLLLEKDFGSLSELEQFIADNPDLDEAVAGKAETSGWLIPIVGIVEVVNGKPKRRPTVLPFDDGMGMPWERECAFDFCRNLLYAYRESCACRNRHCLHLLAEHDVKALTEGEERSTSRMIYQIVRNLVKRGYGILSARSGGLLGEWGEEGDPAPIALEMEIVFNDNYNFEVPIPAGIPYSEVYGKITFAGGFNMDDDEELLEATKERIHSNLGGDISADELGVMVLPFLEDAMEEIALEKLLEWSEALPERA